MKKIIIAGSRTFDNYKILCYWLDLCFAKIKPPIEVVSGGAPGADLLGERYANEHGHELKLFSAQWKSKGKKAGIIRNTAMGDYADRLIAFWDGKSKGTKHMIEYMKSLKKSVQIIYPDINGG